MKYSLKVIQIEEDFLWRVVENATKNIIDDYVFEDDAKTVIKFFSNGGGFDGWTPKFILLKPKLSNPYADS